jgi:hypothetical protein
MILQHWPQVEMRGLTGVIKFDQHGLRSNFELEIVELKKDGLVKVGTWTEQVNNWMTLKIFVTKKLAAN